MNTPGYYYKKTDYINSKKCHCYHCLKTFDFAEITKWTDDGWPICPKCFVDAIIPDFISYDLLEAFKCDWFDNYTKVIENGKIIKGLD